MSQCPVTKRRRPWALVLPWSLVFGPWSFPSQGCWLSDNEAPAGPSVLPRNTDRGTRLLSRLCPARVVERLRDVGPRVPRAAWGRAARAGRLDLLRRDGRPLAQPQAGRGPAGPQSALAERDGMAELLAPCPMCSVQLIKAGSATGRRAPLSRRRCPRSSNCHVTRHDRSAQPDPGLPADRPTSAIREAAVRTAWTSSSRPATTAAC